MSRGQYGHVGQVVAELVTPISLRGMPHVGISLFHTVGDRDRAVEQINTAFHQIAAELYQAMGVDTSALALPPLTDAAAITAWRSRVDAIEAQMHASQIWPIWHDVFNPTYEEWNRFYRSQSSSTEFFTSWEEYEHWHDRLVTLRKAVEKELGHHLLSPPPDDLSETIWQRGAGAAKAAIGDTWHMAKVAIYGGLAIAGVFVLAKLGSDLRSSRDPAQSYLQAYQTRRALPAP